MSSDYSFNREFFTEGARKLGKAANNALKKGGKKGGKAANNALKKGKGDNITINIVGQE